MNKKNNSEANLSKFGHRNVIFITLIIFVCTMVGLTYLAPRLLFAPVAIIRHLTSEVRFAKVFFDTLRDNDFDDAYGMMSSSFREQNSKSEFVHFIQKFVDMAGWDAKYRIVDYHAKSVFAYSSDSSSVRSSTALVSFRLTGSNGVVVAYMHLDRPDDDFCITQLNFLTGHVEQSMMTSGPLSKYHPSAPVAFVFQPELQSTNLVWRILPRRSESPML